MKETGNNMTNKAENPFEKQAIEYKSLLQKENELNERAMRLKVKKEHIESEIEKISKKVKEEHGVDDIFKFREILTKKKEENEQLMEKIKKDQDEFETSLNKIEIELQKIGV